MAPVPVFGPARVPRSVVTQESTSASALILYLSRRTISNSNPEYSALKSTPISIQLLQKGDKKLFEVAKSVSYDPDPALSERLLCLPPELLPERTLESGVVREFSVNRLITQPEVLGCLKVRSIKGLNRVAAQELESAVQVRPKDLQCACHARLSSSR
jgi:hypothetical protein